MKTCVVAMLAFAGTAVADVDRSNTQIFQDGVNGVQITAVPIGSDSSFGRGVGGTDFYSDLDAGPDGFIAFPAATGVQGTADYNSVAGDSIVLSEFGFVGGVDQAAGIVFFDFADSAGTIVDSFGVSLTNPGNFIYTITIGTEVIVPASGLLQMDVPGTSVDPILGLPVDTGVGGQWFLGNAGATIGDAGAPESDPDFNNTFRLNGTVVPAPASAALLGLGGLAAVRRRR